MPIGLHRPQNPAIILLVFCALALAEKAAAQQKREIRPIGCFVNVRSDGEHADGFSIKLWAFGSRIIGLIDYHRGLAGDPPMGILMDVEYAPLTGKIAFEAKLTSGLHYCREHKGVPSQDLLSFLGFLRDDRLEGRIVLRNQLDSPPVVVDERENFVMPMDDVCRPESYESYDIWWWYWKPVYEARGPRW
jgi:hypothetical protein